MKKDSILLFIAIAVLLGNVLPNPINTIVSLIILVPIVVYLVVDIIKNGNS
ncbi:MAG: hypothetical protein PHW34_05345 [Hespellia sp.]|nr:hypothetical protein [Hespellia sp.]